jgi:hypothetical protein
MAIDRTIHGMTRALALLLVACGSLGLALFVAEQVFIARGGALSPSGWTHGVWPLVAVVAGVWLSSRSQRVAAWLVHRTRPTPGVS